MTSAADHQTEIAQLKETIEDLRSTMAQWFELSTKTEEAITPILIDGFKGYLRTAKNGGMNSKVADAAESVLADYCRIYAGRELLPVLRGLAETVAARDTAGTTPADLIQRCRELVEWRNTGLLHKGSGGALRAYAERLEKDGISDAYALGVAESNTASEAMKELVRIACPAPADTPALETANPESAPPGP